MGHRYHNDVVVMYHLDFDYLQHQLRVVIHALRIRICPCTRECDILRLVDPLLINTVIAIEDLSIATVEKKAKYSSTFCRHCLLGRIDCGFASSRSCHF